MTIRGALAALLLGISSTVAITASAEEIAPSARVSSAVLVREGPSTDTAILARLRPGDVATLVGEVSGWYVVELANGTRGYVSKAWTVVVNAEGFLGSRYAVHVIDVGTGLAVFVDGPGLALLYDAGSQDDLHEGDENRVVAYIRAVHPNLKRLDHVILSHPHKDHLQLMPAVFGTFQVSNVWDSGRVNETDGYCHFLKAAMRQPQVRYHDAIASNAARTVTFKGSGCNGPVTVREGEMMTSAPVNLGAGARMTFLYRDAHPYTDPNGNSVVVRLDLGGKSVLLAGDAEGGDRVAPTQPPQATSIEGKLIACCKADLKADALVVGHHGSLTSSRTAFLDAVGASIFAVSSGPYPYKKVRLPDDEIITELNHRGEVFRTDRDDSFRLGDDDTRACELRNPKVGPDADETPGGCDNIVITIQGGEISAAYSAITD